MGYIMELRKIVGHRTLLMPCAGAIIGDGKGNGHHLRYGYIRKGRGQGQICYDRSL